jgi:hypothetical protein
LENTWMTDEEETFAAFYTAIATALAESHNVQRPIPHLLKETLILKEQLQADGETSESVWRMVGNKLLLSGIEQLTESNAQGAEILRLHYLEQMTLVGVAQQVGLQNRHQVHRQQKKALEQLTHLLLAREKRARQQRLDELTQQLGKAPSYAQLFGAAQSVDRLAEELLAPDRSWVVAVVGIGGIGKTAVTDHTIRHIAGRLHFQQIIPLYLGVGDPTPDQVILWLAQAAGLPVEAGAPVAASERQLRHLLKARPCLVLIDGLEADLSDLADRLTGLTNPSKVILTGRQRPFRDTACYLHPIAPLEPEAAAALLRSHAQATGRLEMAAASDDQIAAIYAKVGGNPLALKLIVGLSDKHSLPAILDDLTQLKMEQKIEAMYRYIYWQAWRSLGENGRFLLKAMPLVSPTSGGDLDYLVTLCRAQESRLDRRAISAALDDLLNRSLVEAYGSLWEGQKRYGIHSLTRSFLQTEIIHYPPDAL